MVDNIDEYRPLGELLAPDAGVDLRNWKSPGPVSSAFLQSEALVRALIGPYGSGKTTTCLWDVVLQAMRMPRALDGVRYYRNLTTRDTFRELYKTAIPSWFDLFKPPDGFWQGGQDRPASHKLKFLDDYGPVEYEIQFAAIPEGSIEKWLDGFQVSSIFMNAAPGQPEDVLLYGLGRIGRYPKAKMLPPAFRDGSFKTFILDANKTDVEHWFYKLFERSIEGEIDPDTNRRILEFFDQPGGRHPDAENIENLNGGRSYYSTMAAANAHRPWWVSIFVDNQWGASRSGAPIYPLYDDKRHCAPENFDVIPGLELCLGLDAGTMNGGRPAAVFFQVQAGPRVRVIDELFLGRCGPQRFFDALIGKLMDEPHLRPAAHNLRAWGDPSAFVGADTEGGELTWMQAAEQALAVAVGMPESNELHNFRIPTVAICLEPDLAPGDPMFQIAPRCKLLRAGFNSGYRFKRREVKGETKEDREPEKNDYSHPHDALQHGLTGFFGKSLLTHGVRQRSQRSPLGVAPSTPFSLGFDV